MRGPSHLPPLAAVFAAGAQLALGAGLQDQVLRLQECNKGAAWQQFKSGPNGSEGCEVFSSICDYTGAPPPGGIFWTVKGDTIAPTGVTGAYLTGCSSPQAQFDFGFSGNTSGAIVHKASGMCLGAQDDFCAGSYCFVSRIFDQSPNGNDLGYFQRGGDAGVNASRDKHMVGGHPVYSAYFEPGNGYRNATPTKGVATGEEHQS
eukprot:gene5368-67115_t